MKQVVKDNTPYQKFFAADDGEKRLFTLLTDFDRALTRMPMETILAGVSQQKLTLLDVKVVGEPFYLSDGESYIYWDELAPDDNNLNIVTASSRINHAFICAVGLRREFAELVNGFENSKRFEIQTQPIETESYH